MSRGRMGTGSDVWGILLTRRWRLGLALLGLGLLGLPVAGAEEGDLAPDVSPASASAAATVRVARGPFGKPIELEGQLVPAKVHEIKLEPKRYKGPFELAAFAQGERVAEGDLLLRFETTKYELQVRRSTMDLDLARMALEDRERGHKRTLRTWKLQDEEVREKLRRAEDDLRHFLEVSRPRRMEEQEHNLEGRRDRIADLKEELGQLEKMYKEDDLTEETEEIVLHRARRGLKRTLRALEFAMAKHKRWLQETLGREERDLEVKLEKAKLAFDGHAAGQRSRVRKAEVAIEKARMDLAGKEEAFAELEADAELFTWKAVTGGRLLMGSWQQDGGAARAARERMEAGEKLPKKQVLVTVFPDRMLRVKTTIEEKDLLRVRKGLFAGVIPVADPNTTLMAKVEDVDEQGSDGKFGLALRLDETTSLRPGMAVKVHIMPADAEEGLHIPGSAIASRKDQSVVFVVSSTGGEPRQVAIVPGKAYAGRVSIDKGLEVGQEILRNPPAKD